MAITVVTPPAAEPITLQEAKNHLRIFHNEEDALIEHYISAARIEAETLQHRAYITQTIRYTLDRWPGVKRICLPRSPLQSVTSVEYLDRDGVTQTLAAANYTVNTDNEPGIIILNPDELWPTETLYPFSAIRITFEAGYPVEPSVDYTAEALGTGNGTLKTFTLANTPVEPGSLTVYQNAVATTAYTVDLATGIITFTAAPLAGVVVTADYTMAADLRANIPINIKQAIMFLTAHYYEYREEIAGSGHIPHRIPGAARNILARNPLFWTEELNR